MYIRGLIPRNWPKQFRLVENELTKLFPRKWAFLIQYKLQIYIVNKIINLGQLFHGIGQDIVNKTINICSQ